MIGKGRRLRRRTPPLGVGFRQFRILVEYVRTLGFSDIQASRLRIECFIEFGDAGDRASSEVLAPLHQQHQP